VSSHQRGLGQGRQMTLYNSIPNGRETERYQERNVV
jgi:hypothetical protein